MNIAYFTNQYPAVSHTFIRREILALEALGVTIVRYALRPTHERLVDPADLAELAKTQYVFNTGVRRAAGIVLSTILRQPGAVLRMLSQALAVGWRSDRGLLRHLAYSIEAMILARWCRRDAVEHIHVHFGTNPTAVVMLARHLSGIPYSFTAHGPVEFEKAPLLSLDRKLKGAAFAVCVSSFGRSQLMRWSPPDQWRKISVVHCGVDHGFLEQPPRAPEPRPQFVCVGRLVPQKAQVLLVSAASRLRQLGFDFRVILVGDGEMRAWLQSEIVRLDLAGNVEITGWLSGERVRDEILKSRALVLPSFAENLPVVIMEAMALRRPVITTYVAGIPELVQNEKTGWLVPAGDEDSLVEAIRDALTRSSEQLAAMGEAGHERAALRHNVLTEAAKLRILFECSIAAASGTNRPK